MQVEHEMAKRKKTSYNGDIGEVEVLRELLGMGLSVNSLTGSDYGLDLNLQVPLRPMAIGDLPEEWSLSGRTAYVQVKNMTSGQSASVPPSRVRGWISGSKIGAPVFVVVIRNGKTWDLYTPNDLQRLLDNWQEKNELKCKNGKKAAKTISLTNRYARKYNSAAFPGLLHLWTSHPQVLINQYVRIDDWPYLTHEKLEDQEKGFVAHVCLAWLKAHVPELPIPESGQPDPLVLPIIAAAFRELATAETEVSSNRMVQDGDSTPQLLEFVSKVWDLLVTATNNLGTWPEAALATSYALETKPEAACEEAQRLVSDVMAFYRSCRENFPNKRMNV